MHDIAWPTCLQVAVAGLAISVCTLPSKHHILQLQELTRESAHDHHTEITPTTCTY